MAPVERERERESKKREKNEKQVNKWKGKERINFHVKANQAGQGNPSICQPCQTRHTDLVCWFALQSSKEGEGRKDRE